MSKAKPSKPPNGACPVKIPPPSFWNLPPIMPSKPKPSKPRVMWCVFYRNGRPETESIRRVKREAVQAYCNCYSDMEAFNRHKSLNKIYVAKCEIREVVK